jgi:hypothetical protein
VLVKCGMEVQHERGDRCGKGECRGCGKEACVDALP